METGDQNDEQPRKGLTKPSRTLQALVGPFGAGNLTSPFRGFSPTATHGAPLAGSQGASETLTHQRQILY